MTEENPLITVVAYRPNGEYSACRGAIYETSSSDFEIRHCTVDYAVEFMFGLQKFVIDKKENQEHAYKDYQFNIFVDHTFAKNNALDIVKDIKSRYDARVQEYKDGIYQRKLDKEEKRKQQLLADEAERRNRKEFEDAKIAVAFMKENGIPIPDKWKFLG